MGKEREEEEEEEGKNKRGSRNGKDSGRVRERERRELLSCSFRVIDRSGAWCIHATGSNETCT